MSTDTPTTQGVLRSLEQLQEFLSSRVEQLSLAVDRLRDQAGQLERALETRQRPATSITTPVLQAREPDSPPRSPTMPEASSPITPEEIHLLLDRASQPPSSNNTIEAALAQLRRTRETIRDIQATPSRRSETPDLAAVGEAHASGMERLREARNRRSNARPPLQTGVLVTPPEEITNNFWADSPPRHVAMSRSSSRGCPPTNTRSISRQPAPIVVRSTPTITEPVPLSRRPHVHRRLVPPPAVAAVDPDSEALTWRGLEVQSRLDHSASRPFTRLGIQAFIDALVSNATEPPPDPRAAREERLASSSQRLRASEARLREAEQRLVETERRLERSRALRRREEVLGVEGVLRALGEAEPRTEVDSLPRIRQLQEGRASRHRIETRLRELLEVRRLHVEPVQVEPEARRPWGARTFLPPSDNELVDWAIGAREEESIFDVARRNADEINGGIEVFVHVESDSMERLAQAIVDSADGEAREEELAVNEREGRSRVLEAIGQGSEATTQRDSSHGAMSDSWAEAKEPGELGADQWPAPTRGRRERVYISMLDL